jgi:hypothetical protein
MAISRTKRWQHAVAEALKASANLEEMLQELVDLQAEYEEWFEGMPENLQSSPAGEKLQAIMDLDINGAYEYASSISDIVSECDTAELPLGFGRD